MVEARAAAARVEARVEAKAAAARVEVVMAAVGSGGGGRSAAPVSMASYHNSGCGCWVGSSMVALAGGGAKRADALRKGDVVAVPSAVAGAADGAAAVACVVVSRCEAGATDLVSL